MLCLQEFMAVFFKLYPFSMINKCVVKNITRNLHELFLLNLVVYFSLICLVSHNFKNLQMSLKRCKFGMESNLLPKSSKINKINVGLEI